MEVSECMRNELVVKQDLGRFDWTPEQIQLLKNTVCKNATDAEFKVFCYAVKRSALDPFMKQIHCVKRYNKTENRWDMAIQVGIDGYRLIADRTGLYAGSDDPIYDDEFSPKKATVTVYKIVAGQRCAFTASARWDEYYPGDKGGFMWRKLPCLMLGKVAESLALRKAFPAELSGLYTNEEMDQAQTDPSQTERGGVYPEQPGPEDGVVYPYEDYVVPGGMYVKRGLHEIDPSDLGEYVVSRDAAFAKQPHKKPQWWDDFVLRAEEFLGDLENAPAEAEEVEAL